MTFRRSLPILGPLSTGAGPGMSVTLRGLELGIGIAAGVALCALLARFVVTLRAVFEGWQFARAGFLYNRDQRAWYTRDPDNDDWIYWDEIGRIMLRGRDGDYSAKPSTETRRECLRIGRRYWSEVEADLTPWRKSQRSQDDGSSSNAKEA